MNNGDKIWGPTNDELEGKTGWEPKVGDTVWMKAQYQDLWLKVTVERSTEFFHFVRTESGVTEMAPVANVYPCFA